MRAVTENPGDDRTFVRKTVIVLGLAALTAGLSAALFYTANLILLVFAAVLGAIVLRSFGQQISRFLRVPVKYATALGAALLFFLGLIIILISTPVIFEQSRQLAETLPRALEHIRQDFSQYDWLPRIPAQGQQTQSDLLVLLGKSTSVLGSLFNLFGGLFLMVVLAVFFAIEPHMYIRGLLRLIPITYQKRFSEIFMDIGTSLQWWITGTALSMIVTGLLTTIGLMIIDMPLAILLGFLAGALTFIPTIGPVTAGIPAVMIAFVQDPGKALYVILLYTVIQTIEGNLLTPLIMQRAIRLPPGLILFGQILFGIIFGFPGLALAIPLLSAFVIIIKRVYIEDTLNKEQPDPPLLAEEKT